MNDKIQKAIENALVFLQSIQEKDGSFLCLVTSEQDAYDSDETCPAIVPSNIILSSLAQVSHPRANTIRKSVAAFLLMQKSEYWSYNYWFRDSAEYISLPYPDDLDDTFCALAALYEHDPTIFDGEAMARIATMLTSAEIQESGPYNMWLVRQEESEGWKDIDLVVNSNIAYFLSLQDIHLPGLDAFIEECIESKKYSFPYCSDYPGIYFISRFYKGNKKAEMIDHILAGKKINGAWENPLHTALAISALLNLSEGKLHTYLGDSIQYLLKEQNHGSWKPYSFFFQMRTSEKTVYAGSASITTALCLEALWKYHVAQDSIKSKNDSSQKMTKAEEASFVRSIQVVRQRYVQAGENMTRNAVDLPEKIIRLEVLPEIILLAYRFRNSLLVPHEAATDAMVEILGAANLHGWISYTLFDDFLDELSGPKNLPLAMLSLRESYEILMHVLPKESGFQHVCKQSFDAIDEANLWEVSVCRFEQGKPMAAIDAFGDLSKLAEKSIGHALPVIAILYACGYSEKSREVELVKCFFKHYLIARQLDDDMHDWEEDYGKGRMTWVVAHVFKECGEKASLEEMRKVFWSTTVVTVANEMLLHIEKSRKDLRDMEVFIDATFLASLLDAIEKSASKAIKERAEVMQFISIYETSTSQSTK